MEKDNKYGDQTQTDKVLDKESKGASSTSKKQMGPIPASVSIDIGPKYRVQIDKDDSSSIETVKRIIDSETIISPTTLANITTQIISILTENNIVPTIHINMGPHIDIIRAKNVQNTKTEKGDKSK